MDLWVNTLRTVLFDSHMKQKPWSYSKVPKPDEVVLLPKSNEAMAIIVVTMVTICTPVQSCIYCGNHSK